MTHHDIRHGAIRALLFLTLCSTAVVAQGGPPRDPPPMPPMPRGGARVSDGPGRQGENRIQARINQVVRRRLALTDEQFESLQGVALKIEEERRALRNEEMTSRFTMRQELQSRDRVNETKIGELLEQLPKFERRRLELMEREQRELARFLTPSQRARYVGLQDELRRGVQDIQRRRMGLDSAPDDRRAGAGRGAAGRGPAGRGGPPRPNRPPDGHN